MKESCHLHRRRLRDFCYWRRCGSRPSNVPQLALAPKGGVVVRMTIGSSSGIFAQPAWRDASPGGPSVIVDVISAVVIGVRPVGRGSRNQSLRYVGGRSGRGETCGTPGKASNAAPGGGGAQSERLRKRRQSGVVDLDGSLRPELH